MSESDSFINEVSEEVRRERLYSLLRRYGWIGGVAVVAIVAGAAFNEFRRAQTAATAQALGDAVLGAVEAGSAEERRAAIEAIDADGPAENVLALLTAAERLGADDREAAAGALRPLAERTDISPAYADLAALKLVLLGDAAFDATTRAQVLERLAQPGAPYRLLALEQQAVQHAAEGNRAAAIDAARALLEEAGLSQEMQQRLVQLIVALGGDLTAESEG